MSTTYHTPIATGAAANAATFNAVFGQLDAQLITATSIGTNQNLLTTTRFVDAAFVSDPANKRHTTLANALANASAGDTIIVGNGVFVGDLTIPVDRLKIMGNGQARWTGTNIESGGTIINGTIDMNGKLGVIIQDLTVDVRNGAKDGIKTGSPGIATYGGRIIANVNIVGSGAGNGYHGLLLQQGDYNFVSNVVVSGFTHGIAVKCGFTNISGAIIGDTSASSIIVKSDGGTGDVRHVNISNVILNGTATKTAGAVLVESSIDTQKTEYINISNVSAQYTDPSAIRMARNAIVGTIQHINVSNCVSFENEDGGALGSAAFWNQGASDVTFTNCRAINTDRYSFQNTGSGARISLNGCASDNPATADTNGPFVNRDLAGKANNAVQVFMSANVSIPTGAATFTAVNWDSELFNEREMHSTSTNTSRLVARGAGMYEVTAVLKYAPNATGQRYVRINPSTGAAAQSFVMDNVGASQHTTVMTTGIFSLAENDYVEIETAQTSGGALDLLGAASQSMAFMRKI